MKNAVVCLMFGVVVSIIFDTPIGQTMQEGAKEETIKVSQLPAAVVQAVKTNCAGCSIHKATREVENGVLIYDLEFKNRQGEMDVAEDGSVIDRETVVPLKDVPAAALDAIRKGAAGGAIKQVAKDEIRAELKNGQIIKLDTPKYLYEADLKKGNQVGEIQVTPEGQVTEAPQWRSKGSKEN
jgi:hypothetical protein